MTEQAAGATGGSPTIEERLRAALAPHLQVVRELGAGGMASVFLARDPALKRDVAVKVLAGALAADPSARARFEREAQAVAGLSHPNVVPIYAVGEMNDGIPYFVMQHVAGRSLAARLEEEGPLPVAEARRVLGEVASALAAAHAKAIIHRDIKPANVLYDEESGRALVSDFGIAAVMPAGETKAATKLTQTGMLVGTPQYMSPEQLLSEPVSAKTDIYALGLLGYELLTGKGPFRGTTPTELIAAHLRDVPRRLSEVRDDMEPELESLIARCLEKDAAKRPTADEVARRLAPGGGVLLEWPPPGLEDLHRRLPRLSRLFGMGSALVLIAVLPLLLGAATIPSFRAWTGSLLLVVAGIAGFAVFAVASRETLRLGRATSEAVEDGFAGATVFETLADGRGDTGALIAGTGRFGALPAARRAALRRARLRQPQRLRVRPRADPPLRGDEQVRLHEGARIELDVGRRQHHAAEAVLRDVRIEELRHLVRGDLVRGARRRRHQMLPVHDLVAETVVRERADPLRRPHFGCLRHAHKLLGSARDWQGSTHRERHRSIAVSM